jgi:hypothetical protein
MEIAQNIQNQFFQQIRSRLPAHLSLVDEISELLWISTDSAYRRIRGEKQLSLDEFCKLSKHYAISIDRLLDQYTGKICFSSYLLDEKNFRFEDYFVALLKDFEEHFRRGGGEVIFILNELNLLHVLQVPEVAAFKLFFWRKSNQGFSDYQDRKFSFENQSTQISELSAKLIQSYLQVSTIELISAEALNSFFKQILFYRDSGYFEDKSHIFIVLDKLMELMEHLQKQAECGYKFPFGLKPSGQEGNFQLYYNDLVLADNTILVKRETGGLTYITNNAINLLYTDHPGFFQKNYFWGKNLIGKSTLISGTAERERNRFFLDIRERIEHLKEKI